MSVLNNRQKEPVSPILKKWCVVLGAVILIKMWFIDPYTSRGELLLQEYTRKTNNALRMQHLFENKDNYKNTQVDNIALDMENQSFLFLPDKTAQEALSAMQITVRKQMVDIGLEVNSITFGDPFSYENTDYTRLPLSFAVSSNSSSLHEFFQWIVGSKPFIVLESLSISKKRGKLDVKGQLVGFTKK